jgi:hypothetical protein
MVDSCRHPKTCIPIGDRRAAKGDLDTPDGSQHIGSRQDRPFPPAVDPVPGPVITRPGLVSTHCNCGKTTRQPAQTSRPVQIESPLRSLVPKPVVSVGSLRTTAPIIASLRPRGGNFASDPAKSVGDLPEEAAASPCDNERYTPLPRCLTWSRLGPTMTPPLSKRDAKRCLCADLKPFTS